MIKENEFSVLMDKIIKEEFQEDYELFQYDSTIKQLFSKKKANPRGLNRAADSGILEYLGFISTILGTFKTIKEVYDLFRKNKSDKNEFNIEKVKEFWINDLVMAGLSKTKAIKIANRFEYDMISLIRKK